MGVVSLAASWGCGAFKPREPEPPEGSQPIILLTQPDSVYASMQVGLANGYIQTYINAFDPDLYVFHPDPEDSLALLLEGSNPFAEVWNRQREEQATSSIIGTESTREFVLVGAVVDSGNIDGRDDFIRINRGYQLRTDTDTYLGRFQLHMLRQGNEWRITFWQDVRITVGWGYLKGQNASL
jgi:hypothetical protein